MPTDSEPEWSLAEDPEEVHALLTASDAAQAIPPGPPQRSLASTERYVGAGQVHLVRHESRAVAMFTLTPAPPFDDSLDPFPPAADPLYLTRLAVDPDAQKRNPLLGLGCLRRATAVAAAAGADALRSEANPDLTAVARLLELAGFVAVGPILADGSRRRVRMHRAL